MLKGIVTHKEEWLYPDENLGELPKEITIHTAKNGKEGVQILLESQIEQAKVLIHKPDEIDVELYQMIDIPVEYNTASSIEQDGHFVIMEEQQEKPFYCTRKAPFNVYDCLKLIDDGQITVKKNRIPVYLCVVPKEDVKQGEYEVKVEIVGEEKYTLKLKIKIYDVIISEERFSVTNWFSLNNMAYKHGLRHETPEFYEMVRKYARAMRRVRQTHFFLQLDPKFYLKEGRFNFNYIKPIVEIFFEEGFKKMEVGSFATKGDNVFTDELKCAANSQVEVSSKEGYWILSEMIKSWSEFLIENGWEEKVVYHICDEPDVHVSGPESMVKRKAQYIMIASILRKYLNNPQIIEAVKTDEFKGGVDIWVPLSVNYEQCKEEFDRLKKEGDEVWNYVCCAPTGEYLNRFLDIALLRPRLIFWACSKYNLDGYLHWGFNYYGKEHDPFTQSCCPNNTGQGTSFPAGDSHIAYPGEDGPWISMRLEAQRKGAEDIELLTEIKNRFPKKYQQIIDKVFTDYKTYNDDVEMFETVRQEMLEILSHH